MHLKVLRFKATLDLEMLKVNRLLRSQSKGGCAQTPVNRLRSGIPSELNVCAIFNAYESAEQTPDRNMGRAIRALGG